MCRHRQPSLTTSPRLFFTSGPLARRKPLPPRGTYLFSAAAAVASAWEFTAGEVVWTAMPLFHLSAAATVLAPMLVGGTTRAGGRFPPGPGVGTTSGPAAQSVSSGRARWCRCCGSSRPDPRDAELGLRFISAAPIAGGPVPRHRAALRLPRRHDVRAHRGIPDRGQGGLRRGCAGDVRDRQPGVRRSCRRHPWQPVPPGVVGEIVCRARYPHVMSEGYVAGAADQAAGRARIRSGSTPATSAGSTTTRTSPTSTGSRTGCAAAARTCRRWRSRATVIASSRGAGGRSGRRAQRAG